VGDYNTIMGNTGGDLRAEFDARIPHAIFYDSPKLGGFSANLLFSPGQKYTNLAGSDKYAFAQGEKLCSGATPGSSGSLPDAGSTLCNDGAFTSASSIAVNYQNGPLLATVSYERHAAVDRTSDNGGVTSDESAAKVAATYNFGTNRLSAIYEKFYRGGGIDPTLNERARNGYYVSDVQELGNGLDLMGAWAHAGRTPGGPDFILADDRANMYALGLKYHYDKQASVYLVGAVLTQGTGAHYSLGAGGHGAAIASPRSDSGDTIPGQGIKAVSVGMQYAF
jgi:predicted porin